MGDSVILFLCFASSASPLGLHYPEAPLLLAPITPHTQGPLHPGMNACRLAEGTRRAVAGWGLKTLCRDPRWYSDSLTVIEVPEGIDSMKVVNNGYAK